MASHPGSVARFDWRRITGAIFFAATLAGAVYAARAAVGQAAYHDLLSATDDLPRFRQLAKTGWAYYPFNYRLCLATARKLYDSARALPEGERAALMDEARFWCEQGLGLDPYVRDLRWLKSQFLWTESPPRAIEYWERCVDWDFWFPFNHAVLADMYTAAGDLDNAAKEVEWTRNSEYYAAVNDHLAQARARATPAPPGAK